MTLQSGKKRVVSVGNYRFTGKLLGKGNFAKVEEAIHSILNVKVAIKIMDINQIKEEYVIRNLCREAKIMSKLNHPCIAALYQTMQKSDNVYYLVTELVSGGDLCSFVKGQRDGKLDERPTRIYARQFASALSHMHSLGIVHRDLKMENVMLNSIQTQIKIVDFGLSNVWSMNNPLRTHCGSPEYAAPELFVTGKQYGAEVDLWSLGIILYGMVLGQLPFVSSRCEYTSSQERRRQLVAKINKGLSTSHRRALTSFSPEFRHVLSRLLAAEASKRITIKELLVHPWITDKGKRLIRTNPIKMLDSHWQAKIITEIGSMLQAEPRTVMSAIARDPLGKVGGMFNILIHKHQLNQLTGDGITRTMPSLTLLEIPEMHKTLNRCSTPLKVSTARATQEKKLTATKNTRPNIYTSRTTEGDRKRIDSSSVKPKNYQNPPTKAESNSIKARPYTVQATSSTKEAHPQDYRLIKSPNLRRRAYSAGITQKNNRQPSPTIEKTKLPAPLPVKVATAPAETKRDKVIQGPGKKDAAEISKTAKKLPQVMPRQASASATVHRRKDAQPKGRTPIVDKVRSQSAHVTGGKRPLLVQSQAARTIDKPMKHSSATSATHRQTVPKTSENRPSTSVRTASKEKKEVAPPQGHWERSPLAFGDSSIQTPRISQKNFKKKVISDPIARSIAEYVTNNAGQLYTFSYFKK